jgi:hypothetical protein
MLRTGNGTTRRQVLSEAELLLPLDLLVDGVVDGVLESDLEPPDSDFAPPPSDFDPPPSFAAESFDPESFEPDSLEPESLEPPDSPDDVDVLGPFADDGDRESLMYQPLPLKTMPTG